MAQETPTQGLTVDKQEISTMEEEGGVEDENVQRSVG